VGDYVLEPEEINVQVEDKERFSAAVEGDYVVAVDTEVPEELQREGLAREVVHRLQTMRRSAGFDVADHIETYIKGGEEITEAVDAFDAYIRQETLSDKLVKGDAPDQAYVESHKLGGTEVVMGVEKVEG